MKKIKLNGKLNLNKETVSELNNAQMQALNGGAWFTLYHCNRTRNCPTGTCPTATCPTVDCPSADCSVTVCQSACGNMQCP